MTPNHYSPKPHKIILPELTTLPLFPAQPLVSVLVANYNYARYLPITIRSVQNQTYERWELIIVDDGSTDDSVAVIESAAEQDPRIRCITQKNAGPGAATNAAFAACRGDVVCLLDADDTYLPQKVERVVSSFQAHSTCGIHQHRYILVDHDGRRRSSPLPKELNEERPLQSMLEGSRTVWCQCSSISFRKIVLDAFMPMEPRRVFHDMLIFHLALVRSKICNTPEFLSCFRIHGTNISSSGRPSGAILVRNISAKMSNIKALHHAVTRATSVEPDIRLLALPVLLDDIRSQLAGAGRFADELSDHAILAGILDVAKQLNIETLEPNARHGHFYDWVRRMYYRYCVRTNYDRAILEGGSAGKARSSRISALP